MNFAILPNIDPNFTEDALEIKYVRIYQESAVSSDDVLQESKLNVYPNPVTQKAFINSPANAIGNTVYVYDLQGRLLKTLTIQSEVTPVDMSGWSPGVYLFQQRGKSISQTMKVIKK